jgi:cyanophycin synthetase
MPLQLRDLRALEGPNIYYPQPAVKLQIWADRDISRAISDLVKTWAQQVGVVMGALRQETQPEGDGVLITTTWTTPLPNVGERIGEGVFADLQAAETKDEDYTHDDALFEAIAQRKREEPSLAQLQLYAEAQIRDLPMLPRGDGTLMLGTGARGYILDPAGLGLGLPVEVPWDTIGTIPIVAVTGTNGKTTTTRLITHILSSAGRRVGHTDTDGIYIGDQQVEEGDWAGFGGARRVLTDPQVEVAVLETSRGGILRRGLGFSSCTVSVMTNISGDHLGELGVETVEQLAEVKGIIVLATRPEGYSVLNADDPLTLGMRAWSSAPVALFSRNPLNAAIAEHVAAGGAVVRSHETHIDVSFGSQRGQIALADVPITFGGAALHNVENVLAATAACLSLGLDLSTIEAGLRTFTPDADHNVHRLNTFSRDDMTVVFDYAHNEAGMAALLGFGQQLRQRNPVQNGRLILILGGPGDRSDQVLRGIGQLAGAAVELLLLHEEERYLRGRAPGENITLYRAGAEAAGMGPDHISCYDDEVAALKDALALLRSGDTLLIAAHARRDEMLALLKQWQSGDV